jgi:hypothetical protein
MLLKDVSVSPQPDRSRQRKKWTALKAISSPSSHRIWLYPCHNLHFFLSVSYTALDLDDKEKVDGWIVAWIRASSPVTPRPVPA